MALRLPTAFMRGMSVQDLRNIVEEIIADSIELHRSSRAAIEGDSYERPVGRPTDEEIDDFVASNGLLGSEIAEHLGDPGYLGFSTVSARGSKTWLREFRRNLTKWSRSSQWLAADLPWRNLPITQEPAESNLWRPEESDRPGWLATAPGALLLAMDLLKAGRLLSEMPWRKFEEMIGTLLEAESWIVTVTRPTRDGGIDVVAVRDDKTLGKINSLWQAKRYGSARTVRLSQVRELSALVDRERATKGVIVTTSRLTRGAIDWILRDMYRLDYKDAQKVDAWIRRAVLGWK